MRQQEMRERLGWRARSITLKDSRMPAGVPHAGCRTVIGPYTWESLCTMFPRGRSYCSSRTIPAGA
jgi:hypothetical protein